MSSKDSQASNAWYWDPEEKPKILEIMKELKNEFHARLDLERRAIVFAIGVDEGGLVSTYEHPVEMLRTLEDARMLERSVTYWCRHGKRF